MDRDGVERQEWLDSAQALERLRALNGIVLRPRGLLRLWADEACRSYVDCAFAAGPAPADQLFVRQVRGAGRCELLEASGLRLCRVGSGRVPVLGVHGMAVVRGAVWVYAREGRSPVREDGIWRLDLGARCRPLYFNPVDLQALAVTCNGSGPARQCVLTADR